MSISSRLLVAGLFLALAACGSAQQAPSTAQLPGEAPRAASGLQVPPDAWERPAQVANAPAHL